MRAEFLLGAARSYLAGEDELTLPAELAAELERRGFVECGLSKYQRKTRDEWEVRLTWKGRNELLKGLNRACEGSEECADCDGDGMHLRFSVDWRECEPCNGTGECPCLHDAPAHASLESVAERLLGVVGGGS